MLDDLHNMNVMTHMPFLVRGGGDDEILFFCLSKPEDVDSSIHLRYWHLWVKSGNHQAYRLNTGLVDVMECSPTAWYDDAGWHVTFISGGSGKPHQLYRMDGPTLDTLGNATPLYPARSGFVYKDRMVFGDVVNRIHIYEPTGAVDLEIPGAYLSRVSYNPTNPNRLIISGQWQLESDVMAIEYDLVTGKQSLLECDGSPAYKCAIFENRVLYPSRLGSDREERRIQLAQQFKRTPINVVIKHTLGQVLMFNTCRKGSCGCGGGGVTRQSCRECVDKHLGAACVLLAECRDGHAYRLRAIGHLHEAEDESQAWTKLHEAIRDARRAYQQQGTIPDWVALENLTKAAK